MLSYTNLHLQSSQVAHSPPLSSQLQAGYYFATAVEVTAKDAGAVGSAAAMGIY